MSPTSTAPSPRATDASPRPTAPSPRSADAAARSADALPTAMDTEDAVTAAVARLPEFRREAARAAPRRLVFVKETFQRGRIAGRCGTSLPVYVDHPDRLETWRIYFVDDAKRRVTFVFDIVNGDYLPVGPAKATRH